MNDSTSNALLARIKQLESILALALSTLVEVNSVDAHGFNVAPMSSALRNKVNNAIEVVLNDLGQSS